jgi:LuxR family quorum sensing-dependent transcriptional regulator
MDADGRRNLILDAVYDISRRNSLSEISVAFSNAVEKFGFTAFGVNGLPPPGDGADPRILTERTPEGFRDLYIHERFYLVDHICAHARAIQEPFKFSEAPYESSSSPGHERFMQALETFEMSKGLIVPVGRLTNVPVCVWLCGRDPELDDDASQATTFIALSAANRAHALARPLDANVQTSKLTAREREVLQWTSAGKTSWEISMISGLSERAIDRIITGAMIKLDAVTRTQAVVNAIRMGDVEL